MPPKRRASVKRTASATPKEKEPAPTTPRTTTRTKSQKRSASVAKKTSTSTSRARSTSVSRKKHSAQSNPKTAHYEFGGPWGALTMMALLPVVVIVFAYGCDDLGYTPLRRLCAFAKDVSSGKFGWHMLWSLATGWNPMALVWYSTFIAQLVTFSITLPGDEVEGLPLRDGSRLTYKINGLTAAQSVITMLVLAGRGRALYLPLWIADNFTHFAVASVIISFVIAGAAYAVSFRQGAVLSTQGNTHCPIYDFFMGRELNPRFGTFDLKFFTELRPGLVGWLIIDISMAVKQWDTIGKITNSMALVVIFQAWYIIDTLWNEASILTTMDITTEGFGFILAFGNLCWVPMMYSLQARYLSDFPVDLDVTQVVLAVVLHCGGYYLYRTANNEKDAFRRKLNDASTRDVSSMATTQGSRLLVSGWWGKARHVNYLGDWTMSLAWCLATGFYSPVPYFYTIYLFILLVHRQLRDEQHCSQKYGRDWERYCDKVPYRFLPGIY